MFAKIWDAHAVAEPEGQPAPALDEATERPARRRRGGRQKADRPGPGKDAAATGQDRDRTRDRAQERAQERAKGGRRRKPKPEGRDQPQDRKPDQAQARDQGRDQGRDRGRGQQDRGKGGRAKGGRDQGGDRGGRGKAEKVKGLGSHMPAFLRTTPPKGDKD